MDEVKKYFFKGIKDRGYRIHRKPRYPYTLSPPLASSRGLSLIYFLFLLIIVFTLINLNMNKVNALIDEEQQQQQEGDRDTAPSKTSTTTTNGGSNDAGNQLEKPTVRIHLHLPLTMYDERVQQAELMNNQFISQIVSTMVGIEHFNSKNNEIIESLFDDPELKNCPYTFQYSLFDTGLSQAIAVENIIGSLTTNDPSAEDIKSPDFIIGEARSPVTVPLSITANVFKIPIMSFRSTASVLSDKSLYSTFARTVPSDTFSARATAELLNHFNIKYFGILHADNSFGNSFKEALFEEVQYLKLNMYAALFQPGSKSSLELAMLELNNLGINVFIAILTSYDVEIFAETAKKYKMIGPNKLWIHADNIQDVYKIFEAKGVVREAFEGSMQIAAIGSSVSAPASKNFYKKWTDFVKYHKQINARLPGGKYFGNSALNKLHSPISYAYNFTYKLPDDFFVKNNPSIYAPLAYDTAIAACSALCKSGLEFPVTSLAERVKVVEALFDLSIEGASGTLRFDDNGDRKGASVYLINFRYRSNKFASSSPPDEDEKDFYGEIVGTWSDELFPWNIANEKLLFAGNSTIIPVDITPPYHNNNALTSRDKEIGYSYFVTGTSLCAFLLVWTIVNRNTKIVKRSHMGFMISFIIGDFMCLSAIIPLTIDDGILTQSSCMTVMFLLSVGLVVTMASFIVKTYRVIRVFKNRELKRINISDLHLYSAIFVLVLLDLLFLLMWGLIDPLEWVVTVREANQYGHPLDSYGQCTTQTITFPIILLVYHFIIFAGTTCLTYIARKYPSAFHESKWMNLSLISYFQAFVVGVPAIAAVYSYPSARFLLISTILWLTTIFHLGLIFFPKIHSLFYKGDIDDIVPNHDQQQQNHNSRRNRELDVEATRERVKLIPDPRVELLQKQPNYFQHDQHNDSKVQFRPNAALMQANSGNLTFKASPQVQKRPYKLDLKNGDVLFEAPIDVKKPQLINKGIFTDISLGQLEAPGDLDNEIDNIYRNPQQIDHDVDDFLINGVDSKSNSEDTFDRVNRQNQNKGKDSEKL